MNDPADPRPVRPPLVRLAATRVTLAAVSAIALAACQQRANHAVSRAHRNASEPQVALDGSGHGLGIWIEDERAVFQESLGHASAQDESTKPSGGVVVAAVFERETGFAAPFDLFTSIPCTSPRIGMHADGTAHAAWLGRPGTRTHTSTQVYGARLDPTNGWQIELLQEVDAGGLPLSLATNLRGDTLLAWRVGDRVYATFASAGQPWTLPPLELGSVDPVTDGGVVAAVSSTGPGVVVALELVAGERRLVAHHFAPGHDPHEGVTLDDDGTRILSYVDRHLAAAVDPDGNATVLWVSDQDLSPHRIVRNRFEPAAGWLGAEAFFDSNTPLYEAVFVAARDDGSVHAEWLVNSSVLRSDYTAATGWSEAQSFENSAAQWSSLAMASNGRALTVGSITTGPFLQRGRAAVCHADGVWRPTADVPAAGEDADAAIEDDGLAVVLSLVHDTGTFFQGEVSVVANVWDAPFAEIVVPGPVVAGQLAALNAGKTHARTTDAEFVTYEWDLDGDGLFELAFSDANGVNVTHVFPAPGTYVVSLRVTDEWDYATTVSKSVVVDDGQGGGEGGPPWLLTVVMQGAEGCGTVTSEEVAIDCPTDCDELCADGTFVFLTPTAEEGFAFDHWEGDLGIEEFDIDMGAAGCEFTMHSARTIIAVFVAAP